MQIFKTQHCTYVWFWCSKLLRTESPFFLLEPASVEGLQYCKRKFYKAICEGFSNLGLTTPVGAQEFISPTKDSDFRTPSGLWLEFSSTLYGTQNLHTARVFIFVSLRTVGYSKFAHRLRFSFFMTAQCTVRRICTKGLPVGYFFVTAHYAVRKICTQKTAKVLFLLTARYRTAPPGLPNVSFF